MPTNTGVRRRRRFWLAQVVPISLPSAAAAFLKVETQKSPEISQAAGVRLNSSVGRGQPTAPVAAQSLRLDFFSFIPLDLVFFSTKIVSMFEPKVFALQQRQQQLSCIFSDAL